MITQRSHYNILIVGLFLCTILIAACTKQKSDQINQPEGAAEINYNSITDCHKDRNPFPSQITANIEGTWVWEKQACFWTGPETKTANKHVVVTFNDGGLYKVIEDGKLIAEGRWNLESSGDEFWRINCSQYTEYLNGRVLLCRNELIFYSSYLDGCDYYFKRM